MIFQKGYCIIVVPMFKEVNFTMKKLLVLLLTLSIAFSTFCVTAFAEDGANGTVVEETKTVDSLVGAFYLQGESGAGLMGNGAVMQSDYDYQIADKMAANIQGE